MNATRTPRHYLLLVLKGMAMGAADVVPGVSGGTVAFISGIYEELIDSIRRIDLSALKVLRQQGTVAAWNGINGNFLLAVFAGILLSLFSLARIIQYCLDSYPILVWAFFFGLVCASIIYVARQLEHWRWQTVFAVLIGAAIALAISLAKPASLPGHWWVMFFAGSVAICAMILPGVSGSFMLVLMGLYSVFLEAIAGLDLILLISFAAGAGLGLLSFSHLLAWLLRHYHTPTLAVLTGFLIGSLNLIWPWKQTLETYVDRHGEVQPLVQQNLLPHQFAHVVGDNALLLPAITSCIVGIILVLALEQLAKWR